MSERSSSPHLARCSQLGIGLLEKESAELCVPLCEDEEHRITRDFSDCPKPFAGFGSFRQRNGDALQDCSLRTIEAPAKLEAAACRWKDRLSHSFSFERNSHGEDLTDASAHCSRSMPKAPSPLCKYSSKNKFLSTDVDREEAWERKKAQNFHEADEDDGNEDEEYSADEGFYDALSEHGSEGICSSDSDEDSALRNNHERSGERSTEHDNVDDASHAGDFEIQAAFQIPARRASRIIRSFRKKPLPTSFVKPTRTRSLTDEDLEELRGSIDLGFGFSHNEGSNLTNTLPALELYYAIKKNYVDSQVGSSPVSPLEGNLLLRTSSASSTASPSSDTWLISSPGDHPSEVKTRLRHWAQAVACSVKQGY